MKTKDKTGCNINFISVLMFFIVFLFSCSKNPNVIDDKENGTSDKDEISETDQHDDFKQDDERSDVVFSDDEETEEEVAENDSEPIDEEEYNDEDVDEKDEDVIEPPQDIKIVVITDTHFSGDKEKIDRVQKVIKAINDQSKGLAGTDILVNGGDFVSKLYRNEQCYVDIAIDAMKDLTVPHYLVLGNHDYNMEEKDTNWGAPFTEEEILEVEAIWKEKLGIDPYYSFILKGWRIIALNSMRGRYLSRYFDPDQMVWFEQQFADQRPVILFVHHPLETDKFGFLPTGEKIQKKVEPEFYEIISNNKNNIKGILVGHGHFWIEDKIFDTIPVVMTASIGETDLLSGKEPHTILEGKADSSLKIKTRKDL
jgi:hypothetical protein